MQQLWQKVDSKKKKNVRGGNEIELQSLLIALTHHRVRETPEVPHHALYNYKLENEPTTQDASFATNNRPLIPPNSYHNRSKPHFQIQRIFTLKKKTTTKITKFDIKAKINSLM